jgi:hypothetical protein
MADAAFADGWYRTPPIKGLQAFSRVRPTLSALKLKMVHELTAYNGTIYISDAETQMNHTMHSGDLGCGLLLTRQKPRTRRKKVSRA